MAHGPCGQIPLHLAARSRTYIKRPAHTPIAGTELGCDSGTQRLCRQAPRSMAAANHDSVLQAPTGATDAVLKPSEPVPAGSRPVQGIDFNDYAQRAMTVEELVGGMASMGFQATAVGEAVRIINDMVSCSRGCDAVPALSAETVPLRLRQARTPCASASRRNDLAGNSISAP